MSKTHIVTFHKCGSNWFRRLFRAAADKHGANIFVSKPNDAEINRSVDRDSETTIALHRTEEAENVFATAGEADAIILCVRDPKDVLVSQYFSWLKTHENNPTVILETREKLSEMSIKVGQRLLVHKRLIPFCNAISSWIPAISSGRAHILKYEDLLTDFAGHMGPALELANVPMDQQELRDLEAKYSFSNITNRDPGAEDQSNHYRKGIAGDWMNYFDDRLVNIFNEAYSDICDGVGYSHAYLPAEVTQ